MCCLPYSQVYFEQSWSALVMTMTTTMMMNMMMMAMNITFKITMKMAKLLELIFVDKPIETQLKNVELTSTSAYSSSRPLISTSFDSDSLRTV